MLRRVAVMYNPFAEPASALSIEVATWLRERGVMTWRGISQEARDTPGVLHDTDLMVAMGGDGTVLRAARLCFPLDIPLLAVALGHLSFMSEVQPEEIYEGLERVIQGGGWHDERSLIRAALYREGQPIAAFTALNDVVLSRSDISRVIKAHVTIDDSPLTTYLADGVLVATATGSTAYALAAGGPIVDPRSRSLVLVGIAPHLTNVPSMVLHEDAVVSIRVESHYHAILAVDGRENLPLHYGDEVVVRRSPKVCTFVRLRPSSQFYTRLVERLRRDA
ncbi:NAD(+)/NADH kinase [Candidatus Chloroploca sp. M-50]|uniref:NAD kinase n=2 Tax=Candidatus Chloroploca TaxID=1579476 RepID=A0A2H3KW74_9CHLR|nr:MULTISPECIES: NAD(+)/NADH kinase [Candidatus Chloroploca]MBP1466923.1 NAD(+)/NADH kinase [Candidatus Chloroploca mongolica]PDV96601.1 NAD(+) kinase [Candidatus Chloroploca asiatica]